MVGGKPQPERENLAGLVERVTFHNEDSGFCVLRVKARGRRDLVTVVGHAASISAGEFVHASGQWVNDRTHGLQFRAATNHIRALASMSTAFSNTMPSTAIANLSAQGPLLISELVSENRIVYGLAPLVRPPRPVSRSYAGLRCSTLII